MTQLDQLGSRALVKPAGENCLGCALEKAPCVHTKHHKSARIAIIGESPGATEVEKGEGFVGPSGHVLFKALRSVGIERKDCIITNAALCQPDKESDVRDGRKHCQERLRADIKDAQFIIVLGSYALQSVLVEAGKEERPRGRPSILKWRGSVIRLLDGRLVLPTIHPAFIFHSPIGESWEKVFQWDIQRIGRIIKDGFVPPEENPEHDWLPTPWTLQQVERSLAMLGPEVSLDVETTYDNAYVAKLTCVGLSDGKRTVVIPWTRDLEGVNWWFGKNQPAVAAYLSMALEKRTMVTHNGPGFDHVVLRRHGIRFDRWEDTLLAHHAFAGHMPQNLAHVTTMYLDATAWKAEHHDAAPSPEELWKYNGRDVLHTAQCWTGMQPELAPERRVYEGDKKIAAICSQMQMNGFRFDSGQARAIHWQLRARERDAYVRMREAVGHPLNPRSPKQIEHAILKELGGRILARSRKTGKPVMNVDAMRAYASYNNERLAEFALALLDYRKPKKLRSTYVDIEAKGHVIDGFVHPSWKSYGAVSGRLSCQGPNLANLARPDDTGVAIRSLYVARPGHVLCAFDFSQLEMRIAAYLSGDPVMIAACESSDLHAANAAVLFGAEWEEYVKTGNKAAMKKLRSMAKQSGFAINYGAEAETVFMKLKAMGFNVTLAQVAAMLKQIKLKFKIFYQWQTSQLVQVMKCGYVESPLWHRKRHVGHSPKATEVNNFPIQAGAADIMNTCMPELVARVPKSALIVGQVYDSCIFDVPVKDAEDTAAVLQEVAEAPIEMGGRLVSFPTDIHIAERWSDLDLDSTQWRKAA